MVAINTSDIDRLNKAMATGKINERSPTVRLGIQPKPSTVMDRYVCRAAAIKAQHTPTNQIGEDSKGTGLDAVSSPAVWRGSVVAMLRSAMVIMTNRGI